MIARGAEYGDDRIIVGAHYATDVLAAGRGDLRRRPPARQRSRLRRQTLRGAPAIADFPAALKRRARPRRRAAAGCGDTIAGLRARRYRRFNDSAADEAFVAATQTYGLPVVYPKAAETREDVATLAPERAPCSPFAFPYLSLAEADQILTGDRDGRRLPRRRRLRRSASIARLNLYAAASLAPSARRLS